MGIEKEKFITELERSASQIMDFYKKYCNIHQQIIVDSLGVKIISEDAFVPSTSKGDIQNV